MYCDKNFAKRALNKLRCKGTNVDEGKYLSHPKLIGITKVSEILFRLSDSRIKVNIKFYIIFIVVCIKGI